MDRERTTCINNILTHNSTFQKRNFSVFSALFVGVRSSVVGWIFFRLYFLANDFRWIPSIFTTQKTIAIASCVRCTIACAVCTKISSTHNPYNSVKLSTHSSLNKEKNLYSLLFSFLTSYGKQMHANIIVLYTYYLEFSMFFFQFWTRI